MKIVIAGGSGLVGRSLTRRLASEGHAVSVLSRKGPAPEEAALQLWDGRGDGAWRASLEGADAVVNLCGEGVAEGLWSAARRHVLTDSRLEPTRALVSAVSRAGLKPKVLVNASAVGYYGDRGAEPLTEQSPCGRGFLAELCAHWEEEALEAQALGTRTVLLRIGVVLSARGGALARMLPLFRLGLGGRLGAGTQWFPWIHIDDLTGIILSSLENASLQGPLNAVSPEPADNARFTAALGKALGRPTLFPVPAFLLRLLLGELSGLLLGSQKAEPRAALAAGCRFRHPSIEEALADLLAHPYRG